MRICSAAVQGLDLTGITRLIRPFYGGLGAILSFHRVLRDGEATLVPGNAVTSSQLHGILQYLYSSDWDVISISQVPSRVRNPGSRRFVVLTFDDGYRDNLDVGLPILREFGAPFTVFPCTGFVGRTSTPWFYLLEGLCLSVDSIPWQPAGKDPVVAVRAPDEDRGAFYQRLFWSIEGQRNPDACLAETCNSIGFDLLRLQEELFLSWAQLNELAREPIVTIGAHTQTHPVLRELDEAAVLREMETSRDELQLKLGVPVRHFAYPFGASGACVEREFELARRAGFQTAVTTRRGNIIAGHTDGLWSLPRHTLSMARHSLGLGYLRISLDGFWNTPLNGTVFVR